MVSNQGPVPPDKAGLLVSPQASSTVGAASDITIPSGTLNNDELCPVDNRAGKKRRRTKWRGRRWSTPLCDNSTNSQLFHLTSGSIVMRSAPYNLYGVCALPATNSTKYYGPLIERILLLLAACLVVRRQTCELILPQTALQSNRSKVMPWLCAPGSLVPTADPSPPFSLEPHSTLGTMQGWFVRV